jgi:hypothetical protein
MAVSQSLLTYSHYHLQIHSTIPSFGMGYGIRLTPRLLPLSLNNYYLTLAQPISPILSKKLTPFIIAKA